MAAANAVAPRLDLARETRKIALVSGIGTAIDYYDFAVTGLLSATIWPTLFFPKGSFAASFATSTAVTVGITFGMRPVGAILFGHFGDKIGRKNTLIATLVLAALGTLGIAIAPTYATAGFLGIGVILFCRALFGLAMGGEMGGALSWVTETATAAKSGRRGFATGSLGIFAGIGVICSALTVLVVSNLMPAGAYTDWGWRVVVFIAVVILVVGAIARYWVIESPLFTEMKKKGSDIRKGFPIVQVLKERWAMVFILPFICVAGTTLANLNNTFLAGYLVASKAPYYSLNFYYVASVGAGVAVLVSSAVMAYWSDTLGRKVALLVALAAVLVVAPLAFLGMLPSGVGGIVIFAPFLLALPVGAQGAFFPLFAESYPTRYRQTAAGLTYQMSNLYEAVLFVWVLPWIYGGWGLVNSLVPLTVLCVAFAVVGMFALWYARETRDAPETDSPVLAAPQTDGL
jgi:Major Facilitator Superfamily.